MGEIQIPDLVLLNDAKNAALFCYLFKVKCDYPYNIAKKFQEAIDSGVWENEQLNINSYLSNPSKVSAVLKKLEENQIVILDKKENEDKKEKRSYYRINPVVFLNEILFQSLMKKLQSYQAEEFKEHENYKMKDLARFTKKFYLKTRSKKRGELKIIGELNQWKKFDFFTILYTFYEDLAQYMEEMEPPSLFEMIGKQERGDEFLKITETREKRRLEFMKREAKFWESFNECIKFVKKRDWNELRDHFHRLLKKNTR